MSITLSLFVNPKLQSKFPIDPHSDVQIKFQQKLFLLQKAHLRIESQYFADQFDIDCNVIEINEKFDENQFEDVLRCFYGFKCQTCNNNLFQIYEICQYLKIDSLLQQLNEELQNQISIENFLQVYQLAYKNDFQVLLNECVNFIKKTDIITIQEKSQFSIYNLNENAFENLFLIQLQNQSKIDKIKQFEIIKLFCEQNYNDKLKIIKQRQIISKLIDKNQLSASDYRHIFHNEIFLSYIDDEADVEQSIIYGNPNIPMIYTQQFYFFTLTPIIQQYYLLK